jgi:hypothetical protein
MSLLFCAGCGHAIRTGEPILVRQDAYPEEDPPYVVERRWCSACCHEANSSHEPVTVRYPYAVAMPVPPGTAVLAQVFEDGGGGDG